MNDRATCMTRLQRANRVRSARAQSKKDMTEHGSAFALRLLEDLPWYWETATLEQFLKAVPGVGKTRRRKVLTKTVLNANKLLGELPRQSRIRFAREIGFVL